MWGRSIGQDMVVIIDQENVWSCMARINRPKQLVTQWDVPTGITMRWVCTSHYCLLVKYHCSSEWAVAVLNLYWIHDYTNEILALSRAFWSCMRSCTRSMVLEWVIFSCTHSSLFAWSLSCMIVAYMCLLIPWDSSRIPACMQSSIASRWVWGLWS